MGKLTKKPERLDHEFVRNVDAPAGCSYVLGQ